MKKSKGKVVKKRHKIKQVLHSLYFSKPYKPSTEKPSISKLWSENPPPKPKIEKHGLFARISKPKPHNSVKKHEVKKHKVKKEVKKITNVEKEKKPGFFSRLTAKRPEQVKELRELPKDTPTPKMQEKQVQKPPEKPDFVPLTDKNLEKRLDQMQKYLEKRIESNEAALALVREFIEELKKETDALRKERVAMLEKLNTSQYDQGSPQFIDDSPVQEKKPMGTFATTASQNRGDGMKTSLDQLLDMVHEKGTVKISDASKLLKIKEKQIEEWAKMLEEHGLIEIHYPAVGKPVLKKKT